MSINSLEKNSLASINYEPNTQCLHCHGEWNLDNFPTLQKNLRELLQTNSSIRTLDGEGISKLDSAGAWLLIKWQKKLKKKGQLVSFHNFTSEMQKLLELISKETRGKNKLPNLPSPTFIYVIGKMSVIQFREILLYLSFIGQMTIESLGIIFSPSNWRFSALTNIIFTTGFLALPIIALLSFMIGVVLTYQMGLQLSNYGANIFIVDLLGLAILREFAPLLTAIMIAGRTGSAYTAELGMMKLTQEIDALDTLGVTPTELLLLPRVMGLVISLPLLTMWADIWGIFGGMVMANSMLGITWHDFLIRFPHVIPLKSLLIGLGKAPIFALLIASIGCFQGMQVRGGADSVGKNTTRSVVLSIFFIIVADAIFSILLSYMKL